MYAAAASAAGCHALDISDAFFRAELRHPAIFSGNPHLDSALGPLCAGRVYEFAGAAGSGKTQLCLNYVAHALRSSETVGVVCWISSSASLTACAGRLSELLSIQVGAAGAGIGSALSASACLSRLRCYSCFDVYSLLDVLRLAAAAGAAEQPCLLVIDCIADALGPIASGLRNFGGHVLIGQVRRLLHTISSGGSGGAGVSPCAIIVTNDLLPSRLGAGGALASSPDAAAAAAGPIFGGHLRPVARAPRLRPALGHAWSAVPHAVVALHGPARPQAAVSSGHSSGIAVYPSAATILRGASTSSWETVQL